MKRLVSALLFWLCLTSAWTSSLLDPSWISGELDNGFRYFIRQNDEPRGRLELRLVVNAGSILEAEDQQGLAHYLEHMAFNGTENFEKDALVEFLESLGVAFGPDLNAYTSFDETVYMLKVPTDDPEVVKKAFLVLSDWADGILAEDEAIEEERGVIIEEWRGRRGAAARIRDLQYPLLFKDSRYAERLPIGKLEVLENFEFQRLRDYYRDWYRPELMSVIAVGDLDVENIQSIIEKSFSDIQAAKDPRPRTEFQHPSAPGIRAGVFSDAELTGSQLTLVWNHPSQDMDTVDSFVRAAEKGLVTDMLNQRLHERILQDDAPFLTAGSYAGGFTRAGDVFMVFASVKDEEGAVMEAGQGLVQELARAQTFGFTQGELDRAVARRLSRAEQAAAEADTTPSATLARELIRHALEGEIVLGPEQESEILAEQLPQFTTDDAMALLNQFVDTENVVVMAQGPERPDGNTLPSESELRTLPASAEGLELTPYEDAVTDAELIEELPEAGSVVSRSHREDLNLTTWVLSNGAKVILKPTEFKRDEILIRAWSPGGMNIAPPEEWMAAQTAVAVAEETGLGDFSTIELQKRLAGKRISLSPFIQMDQEGLSAQASPKDLETLLQLIHLRFTTVREDDDAFRALQNRMRESVRNRDSDPKQVYQDLISATLSNYHPRLLPFTLEDVEQMDSSAALNFFRERFENAGDFTFFMVGNLNLEEVEPLITTWIASLPSGDVQEEPAFLETDFPEYDVVRRISKGVEPVSEVTMVWSSEAFTWNYASRHAVHSMVAAMRLRLREELREARGGTYHVSVGPRLSHYPETRKQVILRFGCNPERVGELIEGVEMVVKEMKTELLDESYVEIVQQTQLRRRETDLRENSYWAYVIPFYEWHNEDPSITLELEGYVDEITPESIRETAREVFDTPHTATFILFPEEAGRSTPARAETRERPGTSEEKENVMQKNQGEQE